MTILSKLANKMKNLALPGGGVDAVSSVGPVVVEELEAIFLEETKVFTLSL